MQLFDFFPFSLEYDSDPDLETLWCTDSPMKKLPKQQLSLVSYKEDIHTNGSLSSNASAESPARSDSPPKFFSPSIRINLPSYAAFSSTPNLSSPSWQKIVSANGDQTFSFSFELDNSGIKSDVDMGCSSLHNQSIEQGANETHNQPRQSGASHIVLHMSPSADSGIDVSLRSNHTLNTECSSVSNGSFTAPTSTSSAVIKSSNAASLDQVTPRRYRRCELLELNSVNKSVSSRSALMPITNTTQSVVDSSTCANDKCKLSPALFSNGKRKSSQDIGNENKTRVVSPQ